ncbi:MAG: multicopper oxidase domain-containing protein, partial [Beggiatoa sp.]|nr:multicopper oxidase domain-containing protein [Beggiatoa sp.]
FRSGDPPPPGDLPLHEINDKLFSNEIISQTMGVDTVEEWTMVNKTVRIAHPFHIHINPFQVVEVFEPDSEEAKEEGGPCYADPKKPETWKPCDKLEPPFVWWDVRAIPSARRAVTFDCDACPSGSGDACSFDAQKCTVKIPGYFKMRSRFADFLGQFVQHCHILAHEDRGMMQLIQVSEKRIDSIQKSGYTHD